MNGQRPTEVSAAVQFFQLELSFDGGADLSNFL